MACYESIIYQIYVRSHKKRLQNYVIPVMILFVIIVKHDYIVYALTIYDQLQL